VARRAGAVHGVTTRAPLQRQDLPDPPATSQLPQTPDVKNKTLVIRRALRGEAFAPVSQLFEVTLRPPMDISQAVRAGMARLQFDALLGSRASREREVVCAMVASYPRPSHQTRDHPLVADYDVRRRAFL